MDGGAWHCRLGHMSEKGIKAMLPKGKLSELKSIDLDFCKDCLREAEKSQFLKGEEVPESKKVGASSY